MKKLVAILAFISVLLQTFNQVIIVADFYANRDYIARNLCENRDKPMMHCNGKCCLKKKLASEGKEQAPSPKNQKNELIVTLFCDNAKLDFKYYSVAEILLSYRSYNDFYTASFHHSIFHPPTV